MIVSMIVVFVLCYVLIATEHKVNINKSATALFLGTLLWILYSYSLDSSTKGDFLNENLLEHVADITEIVLFLLGAMTVVEIIDRHGGFNFVSRCITTTNKKKLLWAVSLITFFLSAALDNLTTAIVMIMVLRKLMAPSNERWMFASMVILSANAGGAFSPIGDVTTIMLWINGNISALASVKHLFLPSLASIVVPLLILSIKMHGQVLPANSVDKEEIPVSITRKERIEIFIIGVGGLLLVPIFREVTSLPPFMGILSVVSLLWLYTEILYGQRKDLEESEKRRVAKIVRHLDFPTIFFFFGILLAVSALQEAGILVSMSQFLDEKFHNIYLITGSIGVLSSVVDNVPLVAAAMGMYPIHTPDTINAAVQAVSVDPNIIANTADYLNNFALDGSFWQLLAYCAGVGGSILIIGSAAGVVIMGLEKMTFGWYFKNISGIALLGYLSGILIYFLQQLI